MPEADPFTELLTTFLMFIDTTFPTLKKKYFSKKSHKCVNEYKRPSELLKINQEIND